MLFVTVNIVEIWKVWNFVVYEYGMKEQIKDLNGNDPS